MIAFAWLAFVVASSFLWQFRSKINWEEENRATAEMLKRVERVEDLTERQRLLQEVQRRANRLQTLSLQESMEALRLSQARLQATKYALAAAAVAAIPLVIGGLRQRRRQRWLKTGFCGECGYDLRASREQCPECGAPVPSTA